MNFTIKHEIPGRLRVHFPMKSFSFREADTLEYYLKESNGINEVKVYERTADAVVRYSCDRSEAIDIIKGFSFDKAQVPERVFEYSGRELSARYDIKITASGGVSSMDDVRALRDMGIYGAIIGKAYYTGAIDIKEALETAR